MSFDELSSLLKARNKNASEDARLQGFFFAIAQGVKIKRPTDLGLFEWDRKPKEKSRKLTKDEVEGKVKQAEQWLNNQLM
jgi:hypothetical protein